MCLKWGPGAQPKPQKKNFHAKTQQNKIKNNIGRNNQNFTKTNPAKNLKNALRDTRNDTKGTQGAPRTIPGTQSGALYDPHRLHLDMSVKQGCNQHRSKKHDIFEPPSSHSNQPSIPRLSNGAAADSEACRSAAPGLRHLKSSSDMLSPRTSEGIPHPSCAAGP